MFVSSLFLSTGHRWSLRIPQVFTNISAGPGGSGIFFYPSWRYPARERGWPVWFFIPTRWAREKGAPRRNEKRDGIEARWREKEGARPPGYSWRTRFRLWWAHRRPSREKLVIGRWVQRRSLPPARWSRDKKGELLSRPLGERSRDGNPGEGCSPGGRSLLSVSAARAHGSCSLNFGSDMIIDFAVRLTYLHRRQATVYLVIRQFSWDRL